MILSRYSRTGIDLDIIILYLNTGIKLAYHFALRIKKLPTIVITNRFHRNAFNSFNCMKQTKQKINKKS